MLIKPVFSTCQYRFLGVWKFYLCLSSVQSFLGGAYWLNVRLCHLFFYIHVLYRKLGRLRTDLNHLISSICLVKDRWHTLDHYQIRVNSYIPFALNGPMLVVVWQKRHIVYYILYDLKKMFCFFFDNELQIKWTELVTRKRKKHKMGSKFPFPKTSSFLALTINYYVYWPICKWQFAYTFPCLQTVGQ